MPCSLLSGTSLLRSSLVSLEGLRCRISLSSVAAATWSGAQRVSHQPARARRPSHHRPFDLPGACCNREVRNTGRSGPNTTRRLRDAYVHVGRNPSSHPRATYHRHTSAIQLRQFDFIFAALNTTSAGRQPRQRPKWRRQKEYACKARLLSRRLEGATVMNLIANFHDPLGFWDNPMVWAGRCGRAGSRRRTG